MKLRHPYYSDDKSLSLLTVVTANGDIEYKINCRSFNGVFYIKGKDLLFDEKSGTWVLPQDLVVDHETGEKVLKSNSLLYGVVGTTESGDILEGFYSMNPRKNITMITGFRNYNCISSDILSTKFYREDGSRDIYHDIRRYPISDINRISSRKVSNGGAAHNAYNIEDNAIAYEIIKSYYKDSILPEDRDLRLGSKLIGDLTFGIELETINGNLPVQLRNKYGIIICKDGSIRSDDGDGYPPEYVSVPLSGGKGLQTIREASREISKRSDIDIKCSYHLHIGNIDISRMFMVSMYSLCYKIQDQIFKMFPYYKTNPDGIKKKNYCKKLPNILNVYNDKHSSPEFTTYINKSYSDIFSFLSGGMFIGKRFNRKTRENPWPEGKWNIKSRYYWINFVNLVFSQRNTLEFRLHTPTLNGDKIINWLFICNAISRYAEKYPYKCITEKEIDILDVFNYYKNVSNSKYGAIVSNNMIEYYNERCKYFNNDFLREDYLSNRELKEDKIYNFNILKTR